MGNYNTFTLLCLVTANLTIFVNSNALLETGLLEINVWILIILYWSYLIILFVKWNIDHSCRPRNPYSTDILAIPVTFRTETRSQSVTSHEPVSPASRAVHWPCPHCPVSWRRSRRRAPASAARARDTCPAVRAACPPGPTCCPPAGTECSRRSSREGFVLWNI